MNIQVKDLEDLDTILPGKSLGHILFGSTPQEVVGFLGNPDHRKTGKFGDLELSYESQNLTFSFCRDHNFYLHHIKTGRKTLELDGCNLIGKTGSEIKDFIKNNLGAKISEEEGQVDDDDHIRSWFAVDELNMSFWFDDDVLYLIDLFCDSHDNATYNWPEGSTAAKTN